MAAARKMAQALWPATRTCGCWRGQGVVLLLLHELQGHCAEIAFVLDYKMTQGHHQLLPGTGDEKSLEAGKRGKQRHL